MGTATNIVMSIAREESMTGQRARISNTGSNKDPTAIFQLILVSFLNVNDSVKKMVEAITQCPNFGYFELLYSGMRNATKKNAPTIRIASAIIDVTSITGARILFWVSCFKIGGDGLYLGNCN
jgi:hypothetical protein